MRIVIALFVILCAGCGTGTVYRIQPIEQSTYIAHPEQFSYATINRDFLLEAGPVLSQRTQKMRPSMFGFGILLSNTSKRALKLNASDFEIFVDGEQLRTYSYAEMLKNAQYEKWGNMASAAGAAFSASMSASLAGRSQTDPNPVRYDYGHVTYEIAATYSVKMTQAYKDAENLKTKFVWANTQNLRAQLLWSWGGLAEYYWRDETLESGKQILRVVWVHLDNLKKLDGDKQLELRLRIEDERFDFRFSHRRIPNG